MKFTQSEHFSPREESSAMPSVTADEIQSLEAQVNSSPSKESIQDLIQLYNKVIEHYESRNDNKYLFYHDKLHTMLMKRPILSVLVQNSTEKLLEQKKKQMEDLPVLQRHSQDKAKVKDRKIQCAKLLKKLKKKEKNEVDEAFIQVEAFLDNHYQQKEKKIEELQTEHQRSLSNLLTASCDRDILSKLIDDLHRQFRAKMSEISKEFDTQRYQGLLALKQTFFV